MNRREFVLRSGGAAVSLSLASRAFAGIQSPSVSLMPGRSYDYQLCYVPCYGQSLSLGAGGVPALSLRQRFDSVMFAGGTIAQGFSQNLSQVYGALTPLVENNNQANFNTGFILYPGETPLSGAFEATKELMLSQDGLGIGDLTYKFLGSAPGQGGVGIQQLSRATAPYDRLLYEVGAAQTLAVAAKLSCGVPAIFWLQGESDADLAQDEYFGYLQTLFQDLNADIKAITAQAKDVQFFTYQTASSPCFAMACAQYQLSTVQANVHVASPAYPLQTQGDGTHLTALSYKLLGAYMGSAYKRVVINHDQWLPLSPASIHATDKNIVIDLNIQGSAVVADLFTATTTCPVKPSLGFTLYDENQAQLDIDGNVKVTGPAQISITSPAVTSGFTLAYGAQQNGSGGGNIRDNYGDQYVFGGGGLQQPMHNWLTAFSYAFSTKGSSVTLAASSAVVAPGQNISLTTKVVASLGTTTPTGHVSFYSGSLLLGTAALAGAVATLAFPVPYVAAGQYPVTAVYNGDSNFSSATSSPITVTVLAALSQRNFK